MKLKRFITDEEETQLKELSKIDDLNIKESQSVGNGNYNGVLNKEEMPDEIATINNILKDVIVDYYRFYNFKGEKIRLAYNWNYGLATMPYDGVGYITIKELKEGFEIV